MTEQEAFSIIIDEFVLQNKLTDEIIEELKKIKPKHLISFAKMIQDKNEAPIWITKNTILKTCKR